MTEKIILFVALCDDPSASTVTLHYGVSREFGSKETVDATTSPITFSNDFKAAVAQSDAVFVVECPPKAADAGSGCPASGTCNSKGCGKNEICFAVLNAVLNAIRALIPQEKNEAKEFYVSDLVLFELDLQLAYYKDSNGNLQAYAALFDDPSVSDDPDYRQLIKDIRCGKIIYPPSECPAECKVACAATTWRNDIIGYYSVEVLVSIHEESADIKAAVQNAADRVVAELTADNAAQTKKLHAAINAVAAKQKKCCKKLHRSLTFVLFITLIGTGILVWQFIKSHTKG